MKFGLFIILFQAMFINSMQHDNSRVIKKDINAENQNTTLEKAKGKKFLHYVKAGDPIPDDYVTVEQAIYCLNQIGKEEKRGQGYNTAREL